MLHDSPPKGPSRENPVAAAMPTLIARRMARLMCSGTFLLLLDILDTSEV